MQKKKKSPFWVNFKSPFLARWTSQNQDLSKLFCRKWNTVRDTQTVHDMRHPLEQGESKFPDCLRWKGTLNQEVYLLGWVLNWWDTKQPLCLTPGPKFKQAAPISATIVTPLGPSLTMFLNQLDKPCALESTRLWGPSCPGGLKHQFSFAFSLGLAPLTSDNPHPRFPRWDLSPHWLPNSKHWMVLLEKKPGRLDPGFFPNLPSLPDCTWQWAMVPDESMNAGSTVLPSYAQELSPAPREKRAIRSSLLRLQKGHLSSREQALQPSLSPRKRRLQEEMDSSQGA